MCVLIWWFVEIEIGGWDEEALVDPFELPFVLTLNVGFGIETVCDFEAFPTDWRLVAVPPDFFEFDRSNADLVSFLGCTSAERSL